MEQGQDPDRPVTPGAPPTPVDLEGLFDPFLLLRAVRDPQGVIEDFTVLAANRSACTGMGLDPAQVPGARLLTLLTPAERALLPDRYVAVVETGTRLTMDAVELHDPGHPGATRRFDVRALRVDDGLSVTWREVTAAWQEHQDLLAARDALGESERRNRMVAEMSTDFVMEIGPDLHIRWVSPSATSVVGWLPEEMIGRTPMELTASDEAPESAQHLAASLAGSRLAGRRLLRCKDGSHRWLHRTTRPLTRADGTPDGIVVGFRDIQVEVDAEEALAASESHYRLLADNASDIVFRAGPDDIIEWLSPSIRDVLGWEPSDVIGTNALHLVHPDDIAAVATAVAAVAALGHVSAEARFRHRDGTYRWLAVSGQALRDADGRPIGRTGSLHDVTTRHAALEALHASEERFRSMVDGLLDPLVMLDPIRDASGVIVDFRYAYANPAACAYNRLTLDDTLGHRMLELFPAHADFGMLDAYARVIEDGEPCSLDDFGYRDSHAYGTETRYADIRAFRIGGSLVLTWRDTTAPHLAEIALRESEARYRLLADSAVDIVTLGKPDTTLTWVSPSVTTILGWDADALLGRRVVDLIHPDDQGAWRSLGVTGDRSEAVKYEARFLQPDGGWRWMSVATTVVRDAQGTPVARTGIARDVSAEHAAREALETSRAELAEAQRLAHVGSWSWGSDGTITWSDEMFRIMGMPPASAPPSLDEQLARVGPVVFEQIVGASTQSLRDGLPYEIALDIRDLDQGSRHVILRGEPVLDLAGVPVAIRGTAADVTELSDAMRHIEELNEGLEQRVRERTEELETFTYTLSHDLRAPLRWINGFAAMLQRREADRLDETSHHYLDEIRTASDRMGRLFEELLAYSRMGRHAVRAEPVGWDEVIASLQGTFGPRVAASDATFRVEQPLPPVIADRMLLERALTNLVDNGLTYARDGVPADVRLSARRLGGMVRVTVSDTGQGIPLEHQDRIFVPFVRLHDDAVPGTGIGLAIVARAVRLMGARVRIDSTPGVGSRFWFDLPAA